MRHSGFLSVVSLLAGIASAQQSAWGQCGGTQWTGATTCVSGYTCVKQNDYYSQCQPGSAPTTLSTAVQTSSAPVASSTSGPVTGGPGTTLQSGYYWIRAVESPYFHYYLQSQTLYQTGTGVLGSYTTAGQFQVVDGQLVQLVSTPGAAAQLLYAVVSQNASFDGRALGVTFSTAKNTYGTWGWQGDGLTWSTPEISRPNSIAWYVCGDNHAVYLNLGAYLYNTPSGCADETIHYYNDSKANGKREEEEAVEAFEE